MRTFDLEEHLCTFLSKHLGEESPILVGFSGGVDSFSLLYALRHQKRRVVAVHVDHGWREESAQEAELLGQTVASIGLEYVCCRLPQAPASANLEDWSRTQRYARFYEVSRRLGIDSIVLAHQGDDQIETVMKRFLEGATIPKLRGMKHRDTRDGLQIFRPLLGVSKTILEDYAQAHKIPYIVDPSNSDQSYLRPRLRHHIIPSLERSFGKRIQQSILRVAQEAQELETYLLAELKKNVAFFETRDLLFAQAKNDQIDPYLAGQLIRFLVEKRRLAPLSRQQVIRAAELFCSQAKRLSQFSTKTCRVIVQGGMACVTSERALDIQPIHCSSVEGVAHVGVFELRWKEAIFETQSRVEWKDLLSDAAVTIYIPAGPFEVCKVTSELLSTASRRLHSPVVLRSVLPGVVHGFRLVGDFLSGYTIPLKRGDRCCEVVLRTKN